jgi:hypothetical protein
MPRTKQKLKTRSKTHRTQATKVRLRKNKLRAARKRSRARPHHRQKPSRTAKR